MSLESYRVPAAVREGVELTPPGSESVFRVKLPSKANKVFMRAFAIASAIARDQGGIGEDADGHLIELPEVRAGARAIAMLDYAEARRAAFIEHCLVMPLPDGLSIQTLRDEYPDVIEWLFAEAIKHADVLDEEASDAAKKLQPTSPGIIAGPAKRRSTDSSSGADGSPSVTAAPLKAVMTG